jgi:hypothetical protein
MEEKWQKNKSKKEEGEQAKEGGGKAKGMKMVWYWGGRQKQAVEIEWTDLDALLYGINVPCTS